MDTESKRQYMETLRKQYLKSNKQEKGIILDEYCKRTCEDRKHAIKKFRYKVKLKKPHERKKRPKIYIGQVIVDLVKVWDIFERPCGQRLKTLLEDEVDKLRRLNELKCSDEIAQQLKKMSPSTIDRRLNRTKEDLKLNLKYKKKRDMTLLSLVPTKTSVDLDRNIPGNTQIDCVEHCGASASGEYVNSLTTVDILFGWTENEALMGKGQRAAVNGVHNCNKRSPIDWCEIHPDNGSNILNYHMLEYAKQNNIELSRSRPYKKNDNCFVEQKNSTHVRKPFGYLRFDTKEELDIMNNLYRNELRIYKNFYQPVMKLTEKLRIKGRVHRKYDKPQTPYKRIMASPLIKDSVKKELTKTYENSNPAELKRQIDIKIKKLYKAYKKKNEGKNITIDKQLVTSMVSYHLIHQV